MIPVKMTILVVISFFWWGPDSLRSFDVRVILEVQKHLLYKHIEGSVVLKPTQGQINKRPSPAVIVASPSLSPPFFPSSLLLLSLFDQL